MARKIGSRYTAHQVLGRGSAGTVWLGEGPDGPVAIKLLREDLASDQEVVGRFVQERTALMSLDHPNIVGVRDLVVDGDDLALVMDLVRGCDLRSRLDRDRRLAPRAAVSIAADVADALAAAHAAGIVHRDVKPENVLLDTEAPPGPGGAPPALLTDFGIARLVDSPRRTRVTRIIGTPDYLAPEIIEGLPPRASVDIYALATVLYELLAGFAPFGGGHPGAVLRRHVTEAVTPLPGIPDELWAVLAQCLAKAPASRLTAGELAARLREQLPLLVGMPPLDVDAPGSPGDEDDEEDAEDRADEDGGPVEGAGGAGPSRRGGAVPLVRGSAPDSSRDTHTSIKLPSAEELAGHRRPAGSPAGDRRSPHRRTGAEELRRRRIRIGTAAAAALLAAGLGGWAHLAGGDDSASTSREDRDPEDTAPDGTDGAEGEGAGAPGGLPAGIPTAPTAGAASPQGGTGTAPLPRWSSFREAPDPAVRLAGGPRAVALGRTTFVFARGEDGNVWYLTRTGGRYGSWHRLTGISTEGDPAVVSSRAGQLDVFALGTDGLLYRRTLSGGEWGVWSQVDGRTTFDAAPAAASSAPGRIDLVGRTGGDLVTASLVDGRWNAWAVVPTAGRITAAPGLVSRADGTLDAFVVRRADGAVLHLPHANGAWRPSQRAGTLEAAGRPEAAAAGGVVHLLAPAAGGTGLVQAAAEGAGAWGAPGRVAARTADAPALVAADGFLEAWIRTADGGLARAAADR
ncbi:protein kinase [Streptomyces sp. SCUT-3]|uniref:protein kinase domain-containing protein n=2 Tax=unclassified Streptomyces TaxID=2593676 RepID=UPI0015FA54AB|nr:protein kinase [Streptomyces sp. SCUT-3]QMV23226.1 protein kinase [Streptomyces sp. SCUT-3]